MGVHLSSASDLYTTRTMPDGIKIVLIGLDSGCNSLVYLLNQRSES